MDMDLDNTSPIPENSKSAFKYIGIAIAAIIILAIIGTIIYLIYKSVSSTPVSPVTPDWGGPISPIVAPIPVSPIVAPIPASPIPASPVSVAPVSTDSSTPLGVWGRSAHWKSGFNGYPDGLSYNDSQTYCKNYNATLATSDQLKTAGSKGFNFCAYGWLDDQNNGYYTDDPACGGPGYISQSTDPSIPWSTYCYGPIPTNASADVAESTIITN